MDKSGKYGIVAIACSTGGPQALHKLLPMLPERLGVPIVVLQHMPAGFTKTLATRVNDISALTVKEAENGELLLPDTVYIAQGGKHFEVKGKAGKLYANVYKGPPVNNLRPNADVMFESLIDVNVKSIICVVLTGMGSDGTKGIALLKEKKDVFCITQNEESCVVYGMPRAVELSGLSDASVPLYKIAETISNKIGG
ncbi:MAG: chemotaxis protein CheB [Lachnospiraceae bacterium]|nr:chemotaxis protein CheB [Lachnospiraceae bacterium]